MQRFVLLDSIRSLHNVGALFRTADGAGFDRIYLTGITPTPPRLEISKVALGAELSVIWEYYTNPLVILSELRKRGVYIIALEQTDHSIDYREIEGKLDRDICLILGNEISGVSPEILEFVDQSVEIPMRGIKQSLNVTTAAGILMYELQRGIPQPQNLPSTRE